MHFSRILPVLGLLVGARASSPQPREPVAHPLDVRATFDVCAHIHAPLEVFFRGRPTNAGFIDTCLCQSGIPHFVATNPTAIAASNLVGQPQVTGTITNMLFSSASSSRCFYPDHAIPICHNENPCAFQCTDGFTAHPPGFPTRCECEHPLVHCNGRCVPRGACPSQRPAGHQKRRWVGSGSCTEMGPAWAACGVFGGSDRAWECVNTARDLESCGGCVLPLTPYSPVGKDCTALPGVSDVACVNGECVVHRCLRGYVPAHDGSGCILEHSKISQPEVAGAEEDLEFVPARIFGLEHVPLERN